MLAKLTAVIILSYAHIPNHHTYTMLYVNMLYISAKLEIKRKMTYSHCLHTKSVNFHINYGNTPDII